MEWDVRFAPAFAVEAKEFARPVQLELAALSGLLRQFGPQLRRPHCDTLNGSKHANMKELRIKFRNEPWRILFAFDPEQSAILLLGGNKQGDKRWYKKNIPIAEARFRRHLKQLEE